MLVSISPATGQQVAAYPEMDDAEVRRTLALAAEGAAWWRRTSVAERADLVRRIGRELEQRRETMARCAALEMGKPVVEGLAEVAKCVAACQHFAGQAGELLAPVDVPAGPARSRVVPRPLGVILGIFPWNYPYWQVVRAVVPALVAGNEVVVKAASNVTGCALLLEEAVQAAKVPPGVFALLRIPGRKVPAVVADPRVAGVTFTGSTATGRRVAALAAEGPKKCVLELGGSDPYVVLADADLDLAAETCAAARLVNAGQSCCALKRVVVEKAVAEPFLERFVARMASRVPGDPLDPATRLGPLARREFRDEVHALVAGSVAEGAVVALGGRVPSGPGAYYPPTVLTGVTPEMPAGREETFGPVAAVLEAVDEADAVRLANASPYGLAAAVFSRDTARARRLAEQELEAGLVFVNAQVVSHPAVPFGGTKASGYGRELGDWGFREFVNAKAITG